MARVLIKKERVKSRNDFYSTERRLCRSRDRLVQALPVIAVVEAEHLDGGVEHEETEGGQEEAHDGARPEHRGEGGADATTRLQGGPGVCVRGDPHAQVLGHDGGGDAKEEGNGAEHRVGQRRLAGPAGGVLTWPAVSAEPVHGAQEEEDNRGEDRREGGEVLVLCEKGNEFAPGLKKIGEKYSDIYCGNVSFCEFWIFRTLENSQNETVLL